MGRPPPARRRTVNEVAEPYSNFLIPPPGDADDVCDLCRGPVATDYMLCFPCNEASRKLGARIADAVDFVSLAPTGEQLAHELYTYKRTETVPPNLRRPRLVGLAAVLWRWLALHESCLAGVVGASRFDLITTVPSTSGRVGPHPLEELVSGVVSASRDRHRNLLEIARTDVTQRAITPDRYQVSDDVEDLTVLIVDDTWTTGAHVQSASAALKNAGAMATGAVALGRWITSDYGSNAGWLRQHRRAWDWNECGSVGAHN